MPISRFWICIFLLATLSTSCSSAPTALARTNVPPTLTKGPPPTKARPAAQDSGAPFRSGVGYSDASGDMPIGFLDIIYFQASVDEETETLQVVLHMRDIPETAALGQVTNLVEYLWSIFIYLDPSKVTQTDQPGDYYLAMNTTILEPRASTNEPIMATPAAVPMHMLFENRSIYNSSGLSVSSPTVEINPDLNILTFTGRVPGITSNAVFSFDMEYFDGSVDRPDHLISPETVSLATPVSAVTQAPPEIDDPSHLTPAGVVRAYPGPAHYAGDVLTFEIKNDGIFGDGTVVIAMSLDNQEPKNIPATSSWAGLLLPAALDTTGLSGHHVVQFKTADGNLSETYSFNVLPASQRPRNEASATWQTRETDCCIFHYISETAAARDIDFISEHFQKGAEEFSTVTGSQIDQKMNVYLADRMWGNGGFGGGGELLICYTDRYYGPTIGGDGLEVLARHEFSHAANLDFPTDGDGIDFNYEGLAVYLAGGHYKREPLAERGAALYDLGYYVPVGEFISQHEVSYLYSAAMLTYISETYGQEKVWQFLYADDNPNDDQPGSLEAAIQTTLAITLNEFDHGFQAWLEGHEAGEQRIDLRLTVELQDLRRQYQETYSAPPQFLIAGSVHEVTRPEYLPIVMREAHTPANIAIELMISHAQQALLNGDYSAVEALDKVLANILATGTFDDPLAKDYLDIVMAAAKDSYEVLNLDIQGDDARAQVTSKPPLLRKMEFHRINSAWQIQP